MTSPLLSIVVPTRDRVAILAGCIDSLHGQAVDPSSYELLIVDNGSTDGTAELVRAQVATSSRPRITLVDAPIAGVNRARNAGIGAARGEVIAFVDDDELAPSGYIAALSSALADHADVAGVGGPVVDQTGSGRTCGSCRLGAADVPAGPDGSAKRLLGGNMAIRRGAFDEIGPFDERLSGRGDETEWFRRADEAGLRFYYDPDLYLEHRRDVFSSRDLVLTQLRQGRAHPLASTAMGERFRPRPIRVMRGAGHALRHRCIHGWLLAARELGAIAGSIRHPSTLRNPTGPRSRRS